MTRPLNVVALSGGTWRPSRTLVLTQAVLAELATLLPIQTTLIELGDIAGHWAAHCHAMSCPPRSKRNCWPLNRPTC